jgi:hypothetical protein
MGRRGSLRTCALLREREHPIDAILSKKATNKQYLDW